MAQTCSPAIAPPAHGSAVGTGYDAEGDGGTTGGVGSDVAGRLASAAGPTGWAAGPGVAADAEGGCDEGEVGTPLEVEGVVAVVAITPAAELTVGSAETVAAVVGDEWTVATVVERLGVR
jgi:hypothetical protein